MFRCSGVLLALGGWWGDLGKKLSDFFDLYRLLGIKEIASAKILTRNDRTVRGVVFKRVGGYWCVGVGVSAQFFKTTRTLEHENT